MGWPPAAPGARGTGGHGAPQVLPQDLEVARTADVVAHRVDPQSDGDQAQRAEEPVGQRDHLDVEVRVGGTEGLDPELVVLAVAAGLGSLVAERRGGVPGLPRQWWPVLDVGPDQGCGPLRTKGEGAAAAILELVHLLAHHVAGLADAPAEDPDVLEHRGVGQAVTRRLHPGGEGGQQ